jgi:hypothetical protein
LCILHLKLFNLSKSIFSKSGNNNNDLVIWIDRLSIIEVKKAHVAYASLILEVLQHVLFVLVQSAISISSDIIYYSSAIAKVLRMLLRNTNHYCNIAVLFRSIPAATFCTKEFGIERVAFPRFVMKSVLNHCINIRMINSWNVFKVL